jgi:hypothetical protein
MPIRYDIGTLWAREDGGAGSPIFATSPRRGGGADPARRSPGRGQWRAAGVAGGDWGSLHRGGSGLGHPRGAVSPAAGQGRGRQRCFRLDRSFGSVPWARLGGSARAGFCLSRQPDGAERFDEQGEEPDQQGRQPIPAAVRGQAGRELAESCGEKLLSRLGGRACRCHAASVSIRDRRWARDFHNF